MSKKSDAAKELIRATDAVRNLGSKATQADAERVKRANAALDAARREK